MLKISFSFVTHLSSNFLVENKNKISTHSGKTEQKVAKDASNINRAPPFFTRKPSRRQIRRNFDSNHHEQSFETDNKRKFETKSISVPQPAYTYVKLFYSFSLSLKVFLFLLLTSSSSLLLSVFVLPYTQFYSMYTIQFYPLQLTNDNDDENDKILWFQNLNK